MTFSITHRTVSTVGDDRVSGEIGPDEWNDAHNISGDISNVDNGGISLTTHGVTPDPFAAVEGIALTSGAGNIGTLMAGHFLANHGGSDLASQILGLNFRITLSGSGNCDNAYGLLINVPTATGSGTFTNVGGIVGLNISDQTGAPGNSVFKWNIYSQGSNSNNVFDGTLQLNKLTASSLVAVNAFNQTQSFATFSGDDLSLPGTVKLASHTISTLPTPAAGMMAYISDGDAGLAWGATAINSGGSSTKYLVWYNGTNWTVFGK